MPLREAYLLQIVPKHLKFGIGVTTRWRRFLGQAQMREEVPQRIALLLAGLAQLSQVEHLVVIVGRQRGRLFVIPRLSDARLSGDCQRRRQPGRGGRANPLQQQALEKPRPSISGHQGGCIGVGGLEGVLQSHRRNDRLATFAEECPRPTIRLDIFWMQIDRNGLHQASILKRLSSAQNGMPDHGVVVPEEGTAVRIMCQSVREVSPIEFVEVRVGPVGYRRTVRHPEVLPDKGEQRLLLSAWWHGIAQPLPRVSFGSGAHFTTD